MVNCKNVGAADRVLRVLLGVVLLALASTVLHVFEGRPLGLIAVVGGLILLLTAAIGFCPLYIPFKLSTCKINAR